MTGFGRAVHNGTECVVTVEVRSVNNRYLSLKTRLPGLIASMESRIDAIVRQSVSRGTVELFVRLDMKNQALTWSIDEKRLKDYTRAARQLVREKGVADHPPTAAELLALPGVVESSEKRTVPARIVQIVADTVEAGIESLAGARQAEGRRMAAAVSKRLRLLDRLVAKVRRRAPQADKARMKRLRARVDELLQGQQKLSEDDTSLQREIAFLADKSDITEELDRLQSHFKQFGATMKKGGSIGRSLDFLIQEMGREINTIGSKASDVQISQSVVEAKAELEKIREQVQNIE